MDAVVQLCDGVSELVNDSQERARATEVLTEPGPQEW